MGIKRTPIGCRFVLERKWQGDVYSRHKARMVVMGHRGFLQPGRDFQDTYAPTPAMASTRLLQALSLGPHPANGKKLYNMCFDVSTAYLCAPLPQEKPEDIMVVRMPVGMVIGDHRNRRAIGFRVDSGIDRRSPGGRAAGRWEGRGLAHSIVST